MGGSSTGWEEIFIEVTKRGNLFPPLRSMETCFVPIYATLPSSQSLSVFLCLPKYMSIVLSLLHHDQPLQDIDVRLWFVLSIQNSVWLQGHRCLLLLCCVIPCGSLPGAQPGKQGITRGQQESKKPSGPITSEKLHFTVSVHWGLDFQNADSG